jgi:predicted dehydrogenase
LLYQRLLQRMSIFIKQSLSTGKDVFVEKPQALKIMKGRKLPELAEKEKRTLMV